MAEKVFYFAMFDVHSSREAPRTVLRRTAGVDELFSRDLTWKASPLLRAAEHGDTMFDFTEISAAEAERIVARIRASTATES